jgi:hypothetical protein
VRADLANGQRHAWDQTEEACPELMDNKVLVEQTMLLLRFYNSSQVHDRQRLLRLSDRIGRVGVEEVLSVPQLQHKQEKLATMTLQCLQA